MNNLAAEAGRILRFTRNWIQYGAFVFVALCALIGAAKHLLAR